MRIAFFGLGNMGLPMAQNLLKNGHHVLGFDISPDSCSRAKAGGLELCSTPKDALARADAIVSMLPNDEIVKKFYLQEDTGALYAAPPGAFMIDSSTISPHASKMVGSVLQKKGIEFIEAPVSGGVKAAAEGTLTFLVGASKHGLATASPLLNLMGKKIFHVGTVGMGQTAKICNNMLLAINMIGSSEALLLGEANGLDPKILSEILLASSGRNWALEVYNPYPGVLESAPASRDYIGGFPTELMEKDLRISQETASASRTATPMGTLAHQLYMLHRKHGNGRLDFSSIIKMLNIR